MGSRRRVRILHESDGQDLTEYALLLAFLALLAVSVFIGAGGSTGDVWAIGNSHLASADAIASGTTAASSPAPSTPTPPTSGPPQGDHDHDRH